MTVQMEHELSAFRSRHRAPAVGAAIVGPTGPVSIRVTGTTRQDSDDPVRPDDRWHIGSCAKAMTAALWARLVDQATTTWDAPLASCFPDLDVHPQWNQRTIAEALTCTAGISANPSRSDLETAFDDRRHLPIQRTGAVRRALEIAPSDPGQFRYSNLGYVVVGAAIDRLAGTSFETALTTNLFEPLGMAAAGFGPPPRILGHAPRLTVGSVAVGRRGPMPTDDPRSDNPPLLGPAGRLHLTLDDWARFTAMFLSGGSDILRPLTVERLLAPPPGGRMAMGWAPVDQLDDVGLGMQGSNTMWSAAALMASDRERAALVVVNDGRTRLLGPTALLAHRLLQGSRAAAADGA